jgi:hypothetical protein
MKSEMGCEVVAFAPMWMRSRHVVGRATCLAAGTINCVLNRILICLLLVVGCRADSPTSGLDLTLTSDNIGPPLVGFGADMNPYLYCHPNWGDVTEANVQDLEAKVIALHPQHVRIFVQLGWFDDVHNDEISRDDPRIRDSFIRTVRLAQRAGATVNLTLWWGFWKTPEASMKRFAEILAMLINDEHLDAIRYVTIGNESNAHEGKIAMDRYNQCYLALDRELTRVGLRDHIHIVSGDLVATNQERWFANLATSLSMVSDGYSVHMYWDYWDTNKLLRRVSEVPRIVDALPQGTKRPLFITEFGVRGKESESLEPGFAADGRPICDTPIQAMQIAWLMIEALNRGYVATVQWDCYDALYDHVMHYGLIGDVKSSWKLRPAYDVLKLFTHTTQPGWCAVKITPDTVGEAPTPQLVAAATRSDDGRTTIYVLNLSDAPRDIRLNVDQDMYATQWDGSTLSKPRSIRTTGGAIRVTLPPRSLVALTSFRPDL